MNADRFDDWSRALAPALGATASRRGVVGALLATILAPRLLAVEVAAKQGATCQESACPCPCPDPPCFLFARGSGGSEDVGFLIPLALAVAPDGTVYIADYHGGRILYFDAAGTYRGQWGSQGNGNGQFETPFDVAVASDGTVYVADATTHRVQYFDQTGTYLGQWGTRGSGEGQFNAPGSVAVAPDGTVYVADYYNNRIQAFCVNPSTPGTRQAATPGAGTPAISSPAAP